MAWTPISGTMSQYHTSANLLAANYYLKFYQSGTTTAFNMATDSTGGTTLDKCQLDASGYPTTDGTTRFIPYVDQTYKIVLYQNATDADNNTTGSADWVIDGVVQPILSETSNPATLASNVTYTPAGTGAVSTDVQTKLRESVSVKDFGAVGDGVTDDTTAIQAAIDDSAGSYELFFPTGTYVVTATLNLYKGSVLRGTNKTQGHASYVVGTEVTKILFQPVSTLDLFTVQDLPLPSQPFKGKVSVTGFWIDGNTALGVTNSRYCFTLPVVIYGNFADLEIRNFQSGFSCVDTINNRFENIRVSTCTVSCVEYSGSAPPTTDVWEQCTFTDAPIGVRLASGIAIRFVNCILENIDDFGVDVAKECSHINWISGYSENLPLNASGSVFHVGQTGSTSSLTNTLQVIGGKHAGNNTTVQGSMVDVYDTVGVMLTNITASRFTNLIKTDASTANFAVCCAGIQFNSIPTFATDTTKISGFLDFTAVNSSLGPGAYFAGTTTGSVIYTSGTPASTGTVTSNTQSDYEEGTWVATLVGTTSAPTTPVTSTSLYTKVGRLVTVQAYFANVDTTGATGNIRITGLPFAAGTSYYYGTSALNGMGAAVSVSSVPATGSFIDILNAATTVATPIVAGAAKYVFVTITYSV